MSITVGEALVGDTLVMTVSGDLDLAGTPVFRSRAFAALRSGIDALEIDGTGLALIDDTGIGALLGIRRAAEMADRGFLCMWSDAAERALDSYGVRELFA
jgi:anti-anti-sigma regulatory factor